MGVNKSWVPGCQGSETCLVDSDIFGIIIAVYFLVTFNNKVYQFMWTQQKAPDGSRVLRLVQNCGPSVWRLLHVTLLASRGGAT